MPEIVAQMNLKSPPNLTDSFPIFNPPTPFANTPTISRLPQDYRVNPSQIKQKPANPVMQTLFVEDDSESEGDSAVFDPMSLISQATLPSLPSVIPDSVATVKSQKTVHSSKSNTLSKSPQSALPFARIQGPLSQNEKFSPYFGKQTLSQNWGHDTALSPSTPSQTAHHPSQVKTFIFELSN